MCSAQKLADSENTDSEEEEESRESNAGCFLLETPRAKPEWGFSDLEDEDNNQKERQYEERSSIEEKINEVSQ